MRSNAPTNPPVRAYPLHRTMLASAAIAAILPFSPANAQGAQQPAVTDSSAAGGSDATAPPTPGDAAKAHPDPDQAIVVTGVRRIAGDILGGVSVLDKEELTHDVRTSIG